MHLMHISLPLLVNHVMAKSKKFTPRRRSEIELLGRGEWMLLNIVLNNGDIVYLGC